MVDGKFYLHVIFWLIILQLKKLIYRDKHKKSNLNWNTKMSDLLTPLTLPTLCYNNFSTFENM